MKYLFMSLILISCGYQKQQASDMISKQITEAVDPRKNHSIDERILPYYTRFEKLFSTKIVDIPASFKDLESRVLGKCVLWSIGDSVLFREIFISPKIHNKTDLEKEVIIFHELGHCQLLRSHENTYILTDDYDFIPSSIMFPTTIGGKEYYKPLRDYYHKELIRYVK